MIFNYDDLTRIEQFAGKSWYYVDLGKFKQNYSNLLNAFQRKFPNVSIAYSYKTNYLPALCKLVNNLGGYAEVVSKMEYMLALDIGVSPSRVIVNGPGKSAIDIEHYLCDGALVNLDSFREIEIVKDLSRSYPDQRFQVGIRCNFEIQHHEVSRFGIDVKDSLFIQSISELAFSENVDIVSIHCHLPYRDVSTFNARVDNLLEVYFSLLRYCRPKYLDIGGGLGGNISEKLSKSLGISYISYEDYASVVCDQLEIGLRDETIKPCLLIEPGTALVADVMVYVCKVVDIKHIRGRCIAITSGSKVNYQSRSSRLNMPISVISRKVENEDFFTSTDISGYTCMEDDYICQGYQGSLSIGDYIVVENVGSYSLVFKPPFIEPNVAVVSTVNGKLATLKEAEDYDYIFRTYTKEIPQ